MFVFNLKGTIKLKSKILCTCSWAVNDKLHEAVKCWFYECLQNFFVSKTSKTKLNFTVGLKCKRLFISFKVRRGFW